jgi:heptosyltransferase-2
MQYVLELTEREKQAGQDHLRALGLDLNKTVLGIHTGGGGRWRLKQWHEESFIALLQQLVHVLGPHTQIILFGGPLERERNRRIREMVRASLYDAGCDNPVRHFAALIHCCTVVVSGDSLAMHIACHGPACGGVVWTDKSHGNRIVRAWRESDPESRLLSLL